MEEDGPRAEAGGDGGRTEVAKKSAVRERGLSERSWCIGGGAGDGGRVLNGDAKNALVLECGGEEDAVDVEEARSENVEDSEDVDELDERMRRGTPSCAMPVVAGRNQVLPPRISQCHKTYTSRVRSTWLLAPEMTRRTHQYARF